jgi:hypothetical protein
MRENPARLMEGQARAMRLWPAIWAVAFALTALLGVGASAARAGTSRASPCPALCARGGGPELIGVQALGAGSVRLLLLAREAQRLELVLTRVLRARLVAAGPALISAVPREVLTGQLPRGGRRSVLARAALGRIEAGSRALVINLARAAGVRALPAGLYILRVDGLRPAGRAGVQGGALVVRFARGGGLVPLLEPLDIPPPSASTGAAAALTPAGATLGGEVDPAGLATTYHFQYGTSAAYGSQTLAQDAGSGTAPVPVSAPVGGLSSETTYHFRLVASQCGGCVWGTSYGPDQTFTTPPTPQQLAAARALATYQAMQHYFYAGGSASLYAAAYPSAAGSYATLWPFSRALVGTITLAGIPPSLLGGASYQADVADRLTGLSRYWDSSSTGPGFDSAPLPPYGDGGSKYYDDQAWVGLALAQEYRLTGDPPELADAENVMQFVYPGGWAAGASFQPGGIYWTQQGVGDGEGNHDRTTTSTAPNAELALLLARADPGDASSYEDAASAMYGWVDRYLYNVPGNPNYDAAKPALMFDKVRGTGTVDETLRTYNQGAMIALDAREFEATGQPSFLEQAEAIANTALSTFTESYYIAYQPAAFDAIFFRDLLVLYAVTSDSALRTRILQTIETYAQDAWNNHRSAAGLFSFPSSSGAGEQLLDQAAMLQIYAALAWSPQDYDELP